MTREFIVRGQKSEAEAIREIRVIASRYIREVCKKGAVSWTWKIAPEALHGDDGWRAYGRIEWSRG